MPCHSPPRTPHPSCQPSPGTAPRSSGDAWTAAERERGRRGERGDGGEEGSETGDGFKPHPGSSTCRCRGGCCQPILRGRRLLAATAQITSGFQQILARAPSRTTCPARLTEPEREKRAGRRRALGLQLGAAAAGTERAPTAPGCSPGSDISRSFTNKYHCSLPRH